MGLVQTIEKAFNENNIIYFKGENIQSNTFQMEYCCVKNENLSVHIIMDVDEKLKLVKFNFRERRNTSKDINKIKTELLDMNAKFIMGTLAMRSESELITYSIDYYINDDNFSFEKYNKLIYQCVVVYEELKEKEII